MKTIFNLALILCTSFVVKAQVGPTQSSWATAYCNEEYGLNYKAGAVALNKRVSPTAGTGATQTANIALSGIPTDVQIRKAFLWFSIVGQTTAVTNFPGLTLKNPSGTTLAISNLTCMGTLNNAATSWQGTAGTNFASGNTHNYRAEVTLVGNTHNGNYQISGLPTTTTTNPDVDVTGATLMIIYKDNNDCTKGSLFIQDVYIFEGTCVSGNFSNLNLCFPTPPLNAPYTQFINAVDCEINSTCSQITPDAATNFVGDMWNFVSMNSTFNNGSGSVPTTWTICTPLDGYSTYDKSFVSMRGFYWRGSSIPTITSSFNVTNVGCSGTVSVNGSASTGPITNHCWEMVECNASGVPVPSGYSYITPWQNGAPGAYSFPLTSCGKYYRLKLATKSICQPWKESTQIIYSPCRPTLTPGKGSSSKICNGDQAFLNASISGVNISNCTMQWKPVSPAGPIIYSGVPASVIASPTVTTTYECIVTDVTTGCSAILLQTVVVYNNNPTFSPSVNTSLNNYFTVLFTANDLNATIAPGFTYELSIEEVSDANATTTYYTDLNANGTTCWMDYPNPDNFEGFNGTINPSGGSYSQSSCTSAQPAGKFLYNRWYRVTRKTKNDYCDWETYAYIFKVPPPPQLQQGDPNLYMPLKGNEFKPGSVENESQTADVTDENLVFFTVFPNPSTGIFTIETATEQASTVEVFDLQGKSVLSFKYEGGRTVIDLTAFPRGVYLIKAISENAVFDQKIVLE